MKLPFDRCVKQTKNYSEEYDDCYPDTLLKRQQKYIAYGRQ